MIDIDALKRDKRPQSAWVVHALIDRLDAAEADALEQARLNGMGAERELALMAKLEAAEKEREALRAKIEQMERQEPIGWFARLDGDGPLMECKHADLPRVPLYARVGAQAAPEAKP